MQGISQQRQSLTRVPSVRTDERCFLRTVMYWEGFWLRDVRPLLMGYKRCLLTTVLISKWFVMMRTGLAREVVRGLLGMLVWLVLLPIAFSQITVNLISGDSNHDNIIDDADLVNALFYFGTQSTDSDFNGDGVVDDSDINIVLFNYGLVGAEPLRGTRYAAYGNINLKVDVNLVGYRNYNIQLPIVLEAQKLGSDAIYRAEVVLFSNPATVQISVPEPGRYRIQVYVPDGIWLRTQTDTNEAFKIVSPQAGQVLSGEVSVRVQIPFLLYQYSDIELSVDNTPVAWAGDIVESPYEPFVVSLPIYTDEFANGEHVLTVRDIYGHEKSISVTFYNQVSQIYIDPIFDPSTQDGEVPTVCRIRASLQTAQLWEVRILSIEEPPTVVRTYSGTSAFIDVVWDGNTSLGTEAEDGVYEVEFVVQGGLHQRKGKTNKNRVGEVFILLETDTSIFPGRETSWKEYLNFIKNRLRLVGSPYDNPSVIAIDSRDIAKPSLNNSTVVKRINNLFRRRLQLFYVNSHGDSLPRPFFGIGPYTWYSTISGGGVRGIVSFDLSVLTRNVGYGNRVDPPALVWIDACKSAGGSNDGTIGADDFAFQSAVFKSGSLGYGVFLGWNGNCYNYGAYAPPDDCWTFWRRQFWIEATSGRNLGTCLRRTDTFTRNRGFGFWVPGFRPNERHRMVGEFSTSL